MKKLIVLTIVFVAFIFISAWATVINVPEDYPTIQDGINVCNDGDTVIVKPDTYYENISFNRHNITVASFFLTTGDTSFISTTIINGSRDGSVITFDGGETNTAVIIGFTLECGSATRGGGILCWHSNPTITKNVITGNEADEGGGICCVVSDPIIFDNLVDKNFAYRGGGIYCSYSNATISNNIIFANTATMKGAGIYCQNSNPLIYGNRIRMNIADFGGGLYCYMNSCPVITNNLISLNLAKVAGGLICENASDIYLLNNTIFKNKADSVCGGLYCIDSSPVSKNTIFWADTANGVVDEFIIESGHPVFTYCDIDGGWEGEGNIDAYPLFRNIDNRDFHLMATYCDDPYDSPCIDVGDPAFLDTVLDCEWGLGELRSDIGAYGGGDDQLGIDEQMLEVPNQFALMQNYPNPFNAVTIIQYNLPVASDVSIAIYNILGRKVETLVNEFKQAGSQNISFDASKMSSGIYFYSLQAGDLSESKRMILLK